MKTRILIIDDVKNDITMILREVEKCQRIGIDCEVEFKATGVKELLTYLESLTDYSNILLTLDLKIGESVDVGIETGKKIHSLYPQISILVISHFKDRRSITELKDAVMGFIHKNDLSEEFQLALETIRQGHVFAHPLFVYRFQEELESVYNNMPPIQKEVFIRKARLESNRKIALALLKKSDRENIDALKSAEASVRAHLKNIRDAFGWENEERENETYFFLEGIRLMDPVCVRILKTRAYVNPHFVLPGE